jgi:16S rRNA (uracil1498-N3)-methyltransferase
LSDCNGFSWPMLSPMNLILLDPADFTGENHVRLTGRRLDYVTRIHRAPAGSELRVGVIGGKVGRARVERIGDEVMEMTVRLDAEPPLPLPVRLVLALPRPKVLNRTIAAAVSMGIREIDLINAWRVEKSYWKSPRLSEENLRTQAILGLEQAGDTMLPTIRQHQLFVPFTRELKVEGKLALLADPGGAEECPRAVTEPVILAIGPEGGFIARELETFTTIGFSSVNLGRRILRVETALAYLVGRLF